MVRPARGRAVELDRPRGERVGEREAAVDVGGEDAALEAVARGVGERDRRLGGGKAHARHRRAERLDRRQLHVRGHAVEEDRPDEVALAPEGARQQRRALGDRVLDQALDEVGARRGDERHDDRVVRGHADFQGLDLGGDLGEQRVGDRLDREDELDCGEKSRGCFGERWGSVTCFLRVNPGRS